MSDAFANERIDVITRFMIELSKATGDGSRKRQTGSKPPWYEDNTHEAAIFSHLTKWKRGELVDPDSGAHPLVHAAWRCLAIALWESGNVPAHSADAGTAAAASSKTHSADLTESIADERPVTIHNHAEGHECWLECPSEHFPTYEKYRHEFHADGAA